ncbi:MAG: ribonuclease H-like domain-containing protein [Promethearchaeota archaeon]
MDFRLNFDEFSVDISEDISKYKGKTLTELFPNHVIRENDMGCFMEIQWEIEHPDIELDLSITRKHLLGNLKAIYQVGEVIEQQLFRRGINTIEDLIYNVRYKDSANELLKLIKEKDFSHLIQNRYIHDIDLLFCFEKKDLLFLDIETLDLYDSPIIILGMGYQDKDKFRILQYFARQLEEEVAVLEHFKKIVLPNFKGFITYNGKSYDIPYIANRLLYFFDENPLVYDNEDPYEKSNTLYYHVDLYHNCRRKYKGLHDNYTLTNIECQLLDFQRENVLPSSLVGLCYRKYVDNPKRYVGLVKKCIEHNYHDIFSMLLILKELIKQ